MKKKLSAAAISIVAILVGAGCGSEGQDGIKGPRLGIVINNIVSGADGVDISATVAQGGNITARLPRQIVSAKEGSAALQLPCPDGVVDLVVTVYAFTASGVPVSGFNRPKVLTSNGITCSAGGEQITTLTYNGASTATATRGALGVTVQANPGPNLSLTGISDCQNFNPSSDGTAFEPSVIFKVFGPYNEYILSAIDFGGVTIVNTPLISNVKEDPVDIADAVSMLAYSISIVGEEDYAATQYNIFTSTNTTGVDQPAYIIRNDVIVATGACTSNSSVYMEALAVVKESLTPGSARFSIIDDGPGTAIPERPGLKVVSSNGGAEIAFDNAVGAYRTEQYTSAVNPTTGNAQNFRFLNSCAGVASPSIFRVLVEDEDLFQYYVQCDGSVALGATMCTETVQGSGTLQGFTVSRAAGFNCNDI